MTKNLMKSIKERLLKLSATTLGDFQGASEEDIQKLEQYAGGTFPEVYRDFLIHFGRSSGRLFQGTESSLNDRLKLRLREPAEAIIRKNETQVELPENAFVFLMAQGYQFGYFLLSDGHDPPVFHYLEGQPGPTQLSEKLSEYYLACIEQCEDVENRRKQTSTTWK